MVQYKPPKLAPCSSLCLTLCLVEEEKRLPRGREYLRVERPVLVEPREVVDAEQGLLGVGQHAGGREEYLLAALKVAVRDETCVTW